METGTKEPRTVREKHRVRYNIDDLALAYVKSGGDDWPEVTWAYWLEQNAPELTDDEIDEFSDAVDALRDEFADLSQVVVRPEGVAKAYKYTAHSTQLVAVVENGALSWVDVKRTHAGHGNACSMLRVRAYRREGFQVPKSWTVGGGSALHPASVR